MKQEITFVKFCSFILSVTRVLNKETSEVVEISVYDKYVWNYMLNRYNFFKSQKLLYFESQYEISKALGISVDSVQKTIKKLQRLNFLKFYKEKQQGHIFRNVYTKILHPKNTSGFIFYNIENNEINIKDYLVKGNSVSTCSDGENF